MNEVLFPWFIVAFYITVVIHIKKQHKYIYKQVYLFQNVAMRYKNNPVCTFLSQGETTSKYIYKELYYIYTFRYETGMLTKKLLKFKLQNCHCSVCIARVDFDRIRKSRRGLRNYEIHKVFKFPFLF